MSQLQMPTYTVTLTVTKSRVAQFLQTMTPEKLAWLEEQVIREANRLYWKAFDAERLGLPDEPSAVEAFGDGSDDRPDPIKPDDDPKAEYEARMDYRDRARQTYGPQHPRGRWRP